MIDNRGGEGMPQEGISPNPEESHQECLWLIYDYIRSKHPHVSAEDVAQDTIELVLRRGHTLNWSRATRKALKSTADRLAQAARQARQSDANNLHLAYFPVEIAGADERAMERGRLCRAWKMLAASDRALLAEIIYYGVKLRQAAEDLNISYDAVRKRKERACSRFMDHYKSLGLIILALFGAKSLARRALESPASAYTASATSVVALVTIGVAGISMSSPTDPARDHESHVRAVRPVVTSTSGPDDDSRNPRPPARTTSQPTVRPPSTSPLSTSTAPASDTVPAHAEFHVQPNTDKGTKQTHAITANTPMGPIRIMGYSHATDRATGSIVCDRTLTTCPSGHAESQRVAPDGNTYSASPSRLGNDAAGGYPRRGTTTGAG